MISDSTYARLSEMQENLASSSSFSRIEFLKKTDISGDARTSFLGKVRSLMHNMEHEVAQNLQRDEGDWLIMDGAIRKQEFVNLENTIGLAKSFSRKPVFSIDRKNILSLSSYMRHINDGERSCVFIKNTPTDSILKSVMFWYVRIRTFPPMEPLGGIVKIDMRLPNAQELNDTDISLIDDVSAEIFQMRAPSVYPWPRWPNYVYPIRMAERYMISSFLSPFSLSQIGQEMKSMMERRIRR